MAYNDSISQAPNSLLDSLNDRGLVISYMNAPTGSYLGTANANLLGTSVQTAQDIVQPWQRAIGARPIAAAFQPQPYQPAPPATQVKSVPLNSNFSVVYYSDGSRKYFRNSGSQAQPTDIVDKYQDGSGLYHVTYGNGSVTYPPPDGPPRLSPSTATEARRVSGPHRIRRPYPLPLPGSDRGRPMRTRRFPVSMTVW